MSGDRSAPDGIAGWPPPALDPAGPFAEPLNTLAWVLFAVGGAANACFSCHGLDGMGDGVSVPRLAGLDAGYLQKQLEDYANETRADDVMGPIAKWLDDGDRRAVAAWYAALPPLPASGAAPAALAPAIYRNGATDRGVIACASCHGADGQGVGRGSEPDHRHGAYLSSFRLTLRSTTQVYDSRYKRRSR